MRNKLIKNAARAAGRRPGARLLSGGLQGLALSALLFAAACASPEEKVRRYTESGYEFLEAEEIPKANIQFRNALQIDEGIHWVIVGGESGPNARPMDLEWARALRDQCEWEEIPFFFKQAGGLAKNKGGELLDGEEYKEFPN